MAGWQIVDPPISGDGAGLTANGETHHEGPEEHLNVELAIPFDDLAPQSTSDGSGALYCDE